MAGKTIEKGRVYRDVVSGFQGVATAHTEYLGGANRTELTPKIGDPSGANWSPQWFDDARLELVLAAEAVYLPSHED